MSGRCSLKNKILKDEDLKTEISRLKNVLERCEKVSELLEESINDSIINGYQSAEKLKLHTKKLKEQIRGLENGK